MYIPLHSVKFSLQTGTPPGGDTGPDGAVVMSSANGLVGTGFASWYQLQPRTDFLRAHG